MTNTFVCPIVRDNIFDPILSMRVAFTDASSSAAVTCTVVIYDEDGNFVSSSNETNGAASVTGEGSFLWSVSASTLATYSGTAGDDGFYMLYCAIPPESKLHGFRYTDD